MDAPALPKARGPISRAVLELLTRGGACRPVLTYVDDLADDDFQLGLYLLNELHHFGWDGVEVAREWEPGVLDLRRRLEDRFLLLLEDLVGPTEPFDGDVMAGLRDAIASAEGPPLSAWVEERAERHHLSELAVHRSAYQLKEADQHTFAIPRVPPGPAKSALLELQFDEYGQGEPGRTHAELFAATMRSLGLDATYGRYLDDIPGVTLAPVNLLSLFALHRRWTAACVGHLAVFEMTSVRPMTRYAAAHRRLVGEDGAEFYDVHVVADAHHEVVASEQLVPALVDGDRDVAGDVLFGARALLAVEARFAEHVLTSWEAGRSSLGYELDLRDPLPAIVA